MGIRELFPLKFFDKRPTGPAEGDFAPQVVRVDSNDTAVIESEEIVSDMPPVTQKRGPAPD